MNIWLYFKEARWTIKWNTLRSFLSILGIVIGIVSVVIMLGIGKWAEKKLMDQLGEMAKNQLQVYKSWWWDGKQNSITMDTVLYLETVFPELKGKISYQTYGYSQLQTQSDRYGGGMGMSYYGVPLAWFENNDRELLYGSFFTQHQFDNAESVTIINEDLYNYLFPGKNPIGEKIQLEGKIFAVIGVLKKMAREAGYEWKNYEAWIPYASFVANFPRNSEISHLAVFLPKDVDNKLWQKRVSYALMKFFNISHVANLNFQVDSFSSYIDEMKEQQKMMNYLLLAIGSISLLVGGIGVMNIMLVSVTERTKEIWIRKAVGALKADIILQFLVESVLITFLGGIIAIILSYGAEFLINKYGASMNLYCLITPETVGLALIITSITGIVFGILPARRAAKLAVIDALRYE